MAEQQQLLQQGTRPAQVMVCVRLHQCKLAYSRVYVYACLQVGALQERIDELAEELEAARLAAAAAATEAAEARAATAAAPVPASDLGHVHPPAGAGIAHGAGVSHRVLDIELSEPESLGAALSREVSGHVPLMSDDTPLPELHEQVSHGCPVPLFWFSVAVMGEVLVLVIWCWTSSCQSLNPWVLL